MPETNDSNLPVPQPPIRFTGVFASPAEFEHGQRMARALATSTMVPPQYRDNLPNVLVALDVATRANLPPMMVLQGLNVIQGRPSWSAQFIVAAINGCGLFSPLRYEMRGTEGGDTWGCRAVATEIGARQPIDAPRVNLEGPWVTIAMAKAEGWYGRNGSKWQTMPEVMLRWRAASFFGRLYAAHILAGMQSTDELRDAGEIEVNPPAGSNGSAAHLVNPFSAPAPVLTPPRVEAPAPADPVAAALSSDAPAAPRGRGRPRRVEAPTGDAPETPLARAQREAREAQAAANAGPAPVIPAATETPIPPPSGLEPAPQRDPLDPGF